MRVDGQPSSALYGSSELLPHSPPRVVALAVGQRDTYEERPRLRGESPRAEGDAAIAPPEGRPILLYNSECSVCRTISSWVIESDDPTSGGNQAIDERPIPPDPESLRAIHPGLDIWDAYAEIHLILPDGSIKKGGEAIAEVLRRLPNTKVIGSLVDVSVFGFRPFLKLLDVSYRILDRLRPALGCESCGSGVPWWGKPVEWAVKGLGLVSAR